jgi:hypothetical protein|tara:strand:+ start:291 stop:1313 length:1023 start_codon:yes stop_codon:yes gene_type:complete
MVKLKDLLNEGKYTVYFDMGSPGLMSKTIDAKNEKEAEKKVASGLHGKFKIKKVVKEDKKKKKEKWSGLGYDSFESIDEVSFSKVSTEKLLRHYKQMADERLSGSAALTFRLIAKELRKRKVRLPEIKEADLGLTYKKGKTVKVKHKTSGKTLVIIDKPVVRKEYEKLGFYAESVNERRQYKSGGQEMNFIVQQLVKKGNTKSDAIKMTRKHYNDVLKRYKEPWFVHPIKKAEIISSLSANESVNEAPGKNRKDQYYGQAMVKVEPYTYKNQKRNFHDVSMYRDHKKPYNYYLSIRLAHTNPPKVDMIVDTGTHILKKAGKWAQGWIKRRMSGTGQERFS